MKKSVQKLPQLDPTLTPKWGDFKALRSKCRELRAQYVKKEKADVSTKKKAEDTVVAPKKRARKAPSPPRVPKHMVGI